MPQAMSSDAKPSMLEPARIAEAAPDSSSASFRPKAHSSKALPWSSPLNISAKMIISRLLDIAGSFGFYLYLNDFVGSKGIDKIDRGIFRCFPPKNLAFHFNFRYYQIFQLHQGTTFCQGRLINPNILDFPGRNFISSCSQDASN